MLTLNLANSSAKQVYVDASEVVHELNINALGGGNTVTLAKVGQQANVTVDGGATDTYLDLATGDLSLIQNDVTARTWDSTSPIRKLRVEHFYAVEQRVFWLERSGDKFPAGFAPAGHDARRYERRRGMGDNFDIDATPSGSARSHDQQRVQRARSGVCHRRGAGFDLTLNGDFALFLGWQLLSDGDVNRLESLQSVPLSATMNFSATSTGWHASRDGRESRSPGHSLLNRQQLRSGGTPSLVFANQTAGTTVTINGFRSQDQVTVDLPGGIVHVDLTRTGPGRDLS